MRAVSNELSRANHCELAVPHVPQSRKTCECGYSVRDAIVKTHSADLRILAVVSPDRGAAIARQLAPLKAELLFVSAGGLGRAATDKCPEM